MTRFQPLASDQGRDQLLARPKGEPVTRQDIQELLAICEAADDQDTGSLDAFRAAATVGVVADLCEMVLGGPRA
jgi:hypothetical protein